MESIFRMLHMIVEGENPPIGELGAGGAAATDVDQAVAKLIVDEIPDGACLQLGIGGMPNAVGYADRRIRSERSWCVILKCTSMPSSISQKPERSPVLRNSIDRYQSDLCIRCRY